MLATMEFQLDIRSEAMVYTFGADIGQCHEGSSALPQNLSNSELTAAKLGHRSHLNRSVHAPSFDLP